MSEARLGDWEQAENGIKALQKREYGVSPIPLRLSLERPLERSTSCSPPNGFANALGEGLEVEQAQHAPQLNISIEAPGAGTKKAPEDSEA